MNTRLALATLPRSTARRASGALRLLGLLASAVAAAQTYAPYAPYPTYASPPPPPAPPANYDAGRATPDAVSAFVGSITQSTRFDSHSVTRWRAPLCFEVQGLPEAEARYVAGRLSQIASWAGAQVDPACAKGAHNFYVMFTMNADQAAKDWYGRDRDLFDSNATQSQVRAFLYPRSPGAVRVWHSATLFRSDGSTLIPVDPGDPVEPMPDRSQTGSRLPLQATAGLNFALVIIDGSKANGAGLGQLADYSAMAGLADLDLDADVGNVPTILRLFNEHSYARPLGLTAWDQTFLHALYHSNESPRNLRAAIAGSMTRNMAL